MAKSKQKKDSLEISDELTIEKHKENSDSTLSTSVKSALKDKKVQGSLAGIAAIAACGAIGYALSRPSNRRRLSRFSDQVSDYIPGMRRQTTLPERLSNQIIDLVESTLRR